MLPRLRLESLRCAFATLSVASPAVCKRTIQISAPLLGTSPNRRMRKGYLSAKEFHFEYHKRKRLKSSVHMDFCPIRKGVVQRCYVQKPKKPNSALRKVARVRLSTGHTIIAHIPGEGHNLQDHAVVLIRQGGYRDLGHVHHKVIRGALDCAGVVGRISSRTKYGSKKPKKVENA